MKWRRLRAAAMAMGVVGEEERELETAPHEHPFRKQKFVLFGGQFGGPGHTPDKPAVQPAPPDHLPNCPFCWKNCLRDVE